MAPGPLLTMLRHGETEWSRSGQHTGRTDLPLTDAGIDEARAAGALLAHMDFDVVWSSPRQRAQRTAQLAGLGAFSVDDDLAEWDYGELEGLTTAEIQQRYPGWTIWGGPWPGGETAEAVGARADRVIARILAQPDGARVAVVAHGHFLRVLGARWLGAPVDAGRWLTLGTAAVCHLGWEHDWRAVMVWNLTSPRAVP